MTGKNDESVPTISPFKFDHINVYAEFSRPVSISSGSIISVPLVLTHNKYSLSIKTTGNGFTFNVKFLLQNIRLLCYLALCRWFVDLFH